MPIVCTRDHRRCRPRPFGNKLQEVVLTLKTLGYTLLTALIITVTAMVGMAVLMAVGYM